MRAGRAGLRYTREYRFNNRFMNLLIPACVLAGFVSENVPEIP